MWDFALAMEVPDKPVMNPSCKDLTEIRSRYVYRFKGPEILHCTEELSFLNDDTGIISQLSLNFPKSTENLSISDLKGSSLEYRRNNDPNEECGTHTVFLDPLSPIKGGQIFTIRYSYEVTIQPTNPDNESYTIKIDLSKSPESEVIIEGDNRYKLEFFDIFEISFIQGEFVIGCRFDPLPLNNGVPEDFINNILEKYPDSKEEEVSRIFSNIQQSITKKIYANSLHYKINSPIENVILNISPWQEVKKSKLVWYFWGMVCGIIVIFVSSFFLLSGVKTTLLPLQGTAVTLLVVVRGWLFTEHQEQLPLDISTELIRMANSEKKGVYLKKYLKHYNLIYLTLVCILIIMAVFSAILSVQSVEPTQVIYSMKMYIMNIYE